MLLQSTAPDRDGNSTVWDWLCLVAQPTAIFPNLAISVAGCQVVPGDGPRIGGAQSTNTDALPFDLIDLTPTTVVAHRPTVPVDHSASSGSFSAGGRIAVGRGDVLRVRGFERYAGGIFPTIARPSSDLGNQRVTDDGTITVPYAGTVNVAGLDLMQVEQRIAQQAEGISHGHRARLPR
jgi:polysaccharide export outer membrane protein